MHTQFSSFSDHSDILLQFEEQQQEDGQDDVDCSAWGNSLPTLTAPLHCTASDLQHVGFQQVSCS